MRFTGRAGELPIHPKLSQRDQEDIILETAATLGVPATFLAAIRIAEAGGPGREFGVLSEDAPDYVTQARKCAMSVRNNIFRFAAQTLLWPTGPDGLLSDAFVHFMAKRYAPLRADNDPQHLNEHWPGNVLAAYRGSGIA